MTLFLGFCSPDCNSRQSGAVKLDRPGLQQLLITDINGEKQRDATREADLSEAADRRESIPVG